MSVLESALAPLVDNGAVPGLVAAVGRGDDVEVVVLGDQAVGGTPMREDSLFRIASLTKPMIAALTMTLVADGTLTLDDEVAVHLPELASPRVLCDVAGALDDTVPADRAITVRHLLTSTSGHGFPSDFEAPVVQALFERLLQGPPQPAQVPPPDEWMAALAEIPLLAQPGAAYLYNAPFDILGVFLARATGRSLPELFADRLFGPLGMTESGFAFPAGTEERRTSYYAATDDGLVEQDGPDGQWAAIPRFPSGAGGLVSTLADVLAFQRTLLAGGGGVVSAELVAAMTTDQLTADQRVLGGMFLDGQSWGFGGGVDTAPTKPWNVPGRFGWVGGTGTSAYVVPSDGSLAVLLTQVELGGPTGSRILETFWQAAADHLGHHD